MVIPQTLFSRLFIASCFIMLTGCAGQPRKVTASVPLVMKYSTEKPDKAVIPEQYWEELGDAGNYILKHPEYNIQLSPLYISALGEKCRPLEIVDKYNKRQNRIACELHFLNNEGKQDKAWFLEPEIVESTSHVEL